MPSRPLPVELPCCVPVPLQGPEKISSGFGVSGEVHLLGIPPPCSYQCWAAEASLPLALCCAPLALRGDHFALGGSRANGR